MLEISVKNLKTKKTASFKAEDIKYKEDLLTFFENFVGEMRMQILPLIDLPQKPKKKNVVSDNSKSNKN